MNVKERGEALGTFRYVEVRLMETLALWTPITPEMEIKVLFGRHMWDFAQHADWLGKRTFELRKPEQYTKPATNEYVALLDTVRGAENTAEQLTLLYDVIVPGLMRRYESYLAATDRILDAPSVLVIERILTELKRQIADTHALRAELRITAPEANDFRRREASLSSIVAAG